MTSRFIYSIMLFFLITRCSQEKEVIYDVASLKHKTPTEIAEIVGEPDTSFYKMILGKRYYIQRYNQYITDFRHLDGNLKEVILNQPHPLKFDPATITRFGLEYKEPTDMDTTAMILWKNYPEFVAVNFYKVGTKKPDSLDVNFRIYFNMKK